MVLKRKTIHIKDIRPVLPESKEDIKKYIAKCEMYFVGSHCYFGSGAAQGEDMKRLPESKHYQVVFNSLQYELHSLKNEKHGVKKNKNVVHCLSPIQSRLCLEVFLMFGCGTGAYTSCNSLLVACMVSIVRRVLLSPHTTLYLQCIICKLRSISLEQACA